MSRARTERASTPVVEGDLGENVEDTTDSALLLETPAPVVLPTDVDAPPTDWPQETDEYSIGRWASPVGDMPNYECKQLRNGRPCEFATLNWETMIAHATDPAAQHGDGKLRDAFGNVIDE